jgi:tRNA nucleotidyltransferase/poly(A) polymerase
MNVSDELKELASLFKEPLYVVGGAVRDDLAGFKIYDFDLTSPVSPEGVKELLKGSRFKAADTSPKLGTMRILGDKYYEYTAFRTDSYSGDGRHSPDCVKLTGDINKDAFRRDFTINAIYFDIKNSRYVDPAGGIEDIKNKIIRTTRAPEEVFKEDALRILRLVRLAASTGFFIEENALKAAKNLSQTVGGLATERVREEFERIIRADTVNGISGAHLKGVRLLDDLGLLEFILPGISEGKGVSQRADFHKYDVFEHTMHAFEFSDPEVRLAALLHDIAKPKTLRETGRMAGHDKAGAETAARIMNALKYPKKEIEETRRLIAIHMYDLKGETGENKMRLFIQENVDILDKLIKLKRADGMGSGTPFREELAGKRIEDIYKKMKEEGVPFSAAELQVGGKELIGYGVPPEKRGEAMKELLRLAAADKYYRTKEGQEAYLKRKSSSNRQVP